MKKLSIIACILCLIGIQGMSQQSKKAPAQKKADSANYLPAQKQGDQAKGKKNQKSGAEKNTSKKPGAGKN